MTEYERRKQLKVEKRQAREREKLRYLKGYNEYSTSQLKSYIYQASQMREKWNFSFPTRFFNSYENYLHNILTHKENDKNELDFTNTELKFIIYMLMALVEETEYLYDDIDFVFKKLMDRQKYIIEKN